MDKVRYYSLKLSLGSDSQFFYYFYVCEMCIKRLTNMNTQSISLKLSTLFKLKENWKLLVIKSDCCLHSFLYSSHTLVKLNAKYLFANSLLRLFYCKKFLKLQISDDKIYTRFIWLSYY